MNHIQIEHIKLPNPFLFNELKLYAKFVTSTSLLASLPFTPHLYSSPREVPINIKLKLPSERSRFVLRLEATIINMQIPGV